MVVQWVANNFPAAAARPFKGGIMAQLWGGRFTEDTAQEVRDFGDSIRFDRRFIEQDIRGSIAHVTMLAHTGILTENERVVITFALQAIAEEVRDGSISVDLSYEDVHSFVEAELIKRVGDTGKKLHTGRSRNDQVALDLRLYIRDTIEVFEDALAQFLSAILSRMEEHKDTILPGFTHLQKAQPTFLGHHLGAYFQMFRRDREHLKSLKERMNVCPLGSGALAGTTYPLDRQETAELLGFNSPCLNSMDGVSDRDYLLEFLECLSVIMMHLSRFSEEIILWSSDEYRYVTLSDSYSTGSSIMPQKKNPDVAELIRGKTGRVYGALIALLTTMKGLPLAYNKDMQEDKEMTFDAIDTTLSCVRLFEGMLRTAVFHPDRMLASCEGGFTNATDAADYLVEKGMPFRDAHAVSGHLVLTCIDRGCTLNALPLEEYKKASELFEEDIYGFIDLRRCASMRRTLGAPGDLAAEIENDRANLEN